MTGSRPKPEREPDVSTAFVEHFKSARPEGPAWLTAIRERAMASFQGLLMGGLRIEVDGRRQSTRAAAAGVSERLKDLSAPHLAAGRPMPT